MHSDLMGGSTCERVIHCPGSVRLCEQMPRQKTSPAAAMGTALHDVMEKLLRDEISLTEVVGYKAHNGLTITQDNFDNKVAPAYLAIQNFIAEHEVEEYWVEPLVKFQQNPKVFGAIDVLCRCGDGSLAVIDYKFGDGIMVSPEDNMQLLFYAAAAVNDKVLWQQLAGCHRLIVGIIQPRPRVIDPLETFTYPAPMNELLGTFTRRIFQAIEAIDDLEPVLASGKWCRWCTAAPVCQVKLGTAKFPAQINLKNYNELDKALKLIEGMKDWIKSVEALALDQMEKGLSFHSHKLVDKRITRKWISETKVISFARNQMGMERGDVTALKMKTPPQVEEVCKNKGIDFSEFDSLITRESSGVTIAPIKDKRPESPVALSARMKNINK